MTDHQHGSHFLIDNSESFEQLVGRSSVEARLDVDRSVMGPDGGGYGRKRVSSAGSRGANYEVRADGRPSEMVRQLLGRSTTPRGQRPVMVVNGGVIPARLRVTQEVDALGDPAIQPDTRRRRVSQIIRRAAGRDSPGQRSTFASMARLPGDYDSDPSRSRVSDPAWQVFGDVHEPVASRIQGEGLRPVLDIGGGRGALGRWLGTDWEQVVVDASPTQLAEARHPKVRADAVRLPFAEASAGCVAMLWMLYHLDHPQLAIGEAHRVLRPGGLFVACTTSRRNDPELTDGYDPTTFDAEEAPGIVASVFPDVEVESWDEPMTHLPDRDAVVRYCRSHLLPPEAVDRVTPPVWLTKRGCLVYAYR